MRNEMALSIRCIAAMWTEKPGLLHLQQPRRCGGTGYYGQPVLQPERIYQPSGEILF